MLKLIIETECERSTGIFSCGITFCDCKLYIYSCFSNEPRYHELSKYLKSSALEAYRLYLFLHFVVDFTQINFNTIFHVRSNTQITNIEFDIYTTEDKHKIVDVPSFSLTQMRQQSISVFPLRLAGRRFVDEVAMTVHLT